MIHAVMNLCDELLSDGHTSQVVPVESEFRDLEQCNEGVRAHQRVVNVGGGFSHTERYIPAKDIIRIHAHNRVLMNLSRCLWYVAWKRQPSSTKSML